MFGVRGNRVKRHGRMRTLVQCACAALTNGYAAGFARGKVFSGASKGLCVPVLNCSSCPGALGSCPIGALQAAGGSPRHTIAFYVLGTLALFGVVFGRLVCGFACPFGLIQDLLARIPVPKLNVPAALDRVLRKVKYLILALLALGIPTISIATGDSVAPFFCKLFCPVGTLEAGIPLVALNTGLRDDAGLLFGWKVLVLVVILLLCVFVRRPFCKWFCPLGAFYSLFNKFSFYRMDFEAHACVGCKKCVHACPMGIDVRDDPNNPECIRCGSCKASCPSHAIMSGWKARVSQVEKNVARLSESANAAKDRVEES